MSVQTDLPLWRGGLIYCNRVQFSNAHQSHHDASEGHFDSTATGALLEKWSRDGNQNRTDKCRSKPRTNRCRGFKICLYSSIQSGRHSPRSLRSSDKYGPSCHWREFRDFCRWLLPSCFKLASCRPSATTLIIARDLSMINTTEPWKRNAPSHSRCISFIAGNRTRWRKLQSREIKELKLRK